MDINDLRSLVTLAGFIGFLVVVYLTWRRKAQPAHEAASRLVFEGESLQAPSGKPPIPQEKHHG